MNILDFGAKRGRFAATRFSARLTRRPQGGGRVSVPAGEYETASLVLRSNVELHLEAGAVLRFVDDFDAYPVVNIRWEGYEQPCHRPLVYAKNEVNVALTGLGTLEGQGPKWWTAFRAKTLSAARPCAVCFEDCTRVRMSDFVVRNSPSWTIHPVRCEDVTIDKLTIVNPFDSPNTDGIDPESAATCASRAATSTWATTASRSKRARRTHWRTCPAKTSPSPAARWCTATAALCWGAR